MMKKLLVTCTALVVLTGTGAWANVTYTFSHIVEPKDGDTQRADGAIGEAQLFLDVSDLGGNCVLFTLRNIGPYASSITDVYFDDSDVLASVNSIDNSDPGVSFSQFASPSKLPGRKYVSPEFVTDFSFDSDPAVQPNGVNPGELLGISFDLVTGKSFDDVIANLASGGLCVGLHVQGFASGNSESFISDGVIPAPGALVLGSIGLALIGWLRIRRTL